MNQTNFFFFFFAAFGNYLLRKPKKRLRMQGVILTKEYLACAELHVKDKQAKTHYLPWPRVARVKTLQGKKSRTGESQHPSQQSATILGREVLVAGVADD